MSVVRIRHKLRRFSELSLADKWLLLRAVFWLAVARTWLIAVPLRRVAERLSGENEREPLDAELLQRIGYAIRAAAANVPWRSDCFPQAIAARALLRRFGYSSTVHLGVEKGAQNKLLGHAWLTCGGFVVTGGEDLDRYTEIHQFPA